MRYSHKVHIYRRGSQLRFTLVTSILAVGLLLLFVRLSNVSLGTLFVDLLASTYRVVIAYLISLVISVLMALIVTRNRTFEDFLLPVLDVLQSFPSFAILPIAILWFGASDVTAILFLVITILWPVLFNVVAGVKNMRGDLGEAARVFGAGGIKKLKYYLLPGVFPAIVTGSIIGWGEAWEAIVGAEILGISRGIGAFLNDASRTGDTRVLTLGIVFLLFFIFFLNKIIWLPLLKRSTMYSSEE